MRGREELEGFIIHCPTQEVADVLLIRLAKEGYKWFCGRWDIYKENTAVLIPKGKKELMIVDYEAIKANLVYGDAEAYWRWGAEDDERVIDLIVGIMADFVDDGEK